MNPTKKNPPKVSIDHDSGMLNIPGVGKLPLIGPTSGADYRNLLNREAEAAELARIAEEMLAKQWHCARCNRTWHGRQIHMHKPEIGDANVYTVLDFMTKFKPMCPSKFCREATAVKHEFPELTEIEAQ